MMFWSVLRRINLLDFLGKKQCDDYKQQKYSTCCLRTNRPCWTQSESDYLFWKSLQNYCLSLLYRQSNLHGFQHYYIFLKPAKTSSSIYFGFVSLVLSFFLQFDFGLFSSFCSRRFLSLFHLLVCFFSDFWWCFHQKKRAQLIILVN